MLLYLRTVRHLKPYQAASFFMRRVRSYSEVDGYIGETPIRPNVQMSCGIFRTDVKTHPNEFRFLNISKAFDLKYMDWVCPEMDKLWRYNLQYFDYLQDRGRSRETLCELMDSWINLNPPGTEDAWEPFTVSLRIVNWVKWFLRPDIVGCATQPWQRSLYTQALWLEKNLERHLLANHYFKNGKALCFAGMFFDGADAQRWLKKGLAIIGNEVEEQILTDGGHFERSPMYHSMILEDCLDLLNLCQGQSLEGIFSLRDQLHAVTRKMGRFLLGMTHPDGQIALFNDAAFGIEATPAELAEYYVRLTGENLGKIEENAWSFPETGYYVMAPVLGDRLFVDCGSVGPDYQPGHAHSDTLSFELSLNSRRVIVDSGCCQYVDGDIRRYNRGNAGHNTLTIDGENQSEVWGAHRCARRARPLCGKLETRADGSLFFAGAHDGYRRLSGKPVHHRSITWAGNTIVIEDRVEGGGSHNLELRLHIHPDFSVVMYEGRAMIMDGGKTVATVFSNGNGRMDGADGWYCPKFGVKLPCTIILMIIKNASLPFIGGWTIEKGS